MATVLPFLADTSGPFAQLLATEHTAQTLQGWIREKKEVIRTIKRQAIGHANPFEVTYEHIKQLEADIRGFKRLLQSNEASRDHWRRVHMAAWRRALRPLKVTDLPNEILTMIFSDLQDATVAPIRTKGKGVALDDALPSPDVASIQSVRLTCRTFCDLGSRFLLPVVNIAFTSASLQRLEDISSHSTISKGVCILRLHVGSQTGLLANSGIWFRKEARSRLCLITEKFVASVRRSREKFYENRRLEGFPPGPPPSLHSVTDLGVTEVQASRACTVMSKMGNPRASPLTPLECQIQGFIEQAHKEYGRMYAEQERFMLHSQTLANIERALSHMPSVRRLCIPSLGWGHRFKSGWDDRYDIQKYKNRKMDVNYFLDLMGHDVGKESSMRSRHKALGRRSTLILLLKLPFVLQAANGNLTDLDLDLPLVDDMYDEISFDNIAHLQRSCRNLKYARIDVADSPGNLAPAELATTYTILHAILCSPMLEAVTLSYSGCGKKNPLEKTTSIGRVLGNLNRDRLRCLCLKGFPLKLEDLRKFLNRVSGQIHLEFGGIYLIGGTWDEALEILRGRVDPTSRVVDPRGAQLDAMSPREARDLRSEFDSEHRDGFYSFQRCPGPASFYIQGGNIPNPLGPGTQ